MKRSFWSKNCKDLTVGELSKFILYLTAIMSAATVMILKAYLSWEGICEFFRVLIGKIKDLFTKKKDYEEEL